MFDNTALTLNCRALRRLLKQGDDVSQEIDNIVKEINADTDHSDTWKAGKLDNARRTKNSELRKLGAAAMSLIEKIDAQINAQREAFDHRDPDFQAAIATLQFYGKTCPLDVQESIVASLGGNYKALRSIKSAFKSYDLPTGSIDKAIGPLDSLGTTEEGIVSEFVSYAVSDLATENEWRSHNLRSMLDRYEAALQVDSSVNPILSKLDAYIADPNTPPAMRTRAESWRKYHAEGLDEDNPHEMDMTQRRMTAWQNGEAAPPMGE